MNVLRFSDLSLRPWKNGGGSARVIAQYPTGAANGAFEWYVGVADIEQSGAFSAYPGMDRRLIQLEGPPLALRCRSTSHGIDFTHQVTAPLGEFAFQGDWDTYCTVLPAQPRLSSRSTRARVLNVITQRKRVSVRTEVLTVSATVAVEKSAPEHLVLLVAAGTARAMGAGINVQPPLAHLDAIVANEPRHASIALSPAGIDVARLIAIRIEPIA